MQFTPSVLAYLDGKFRLLKSPARPGLAAQRDPAVAATVSQMLSAIELRGMDAVLEYAAQLDGWQGGDVLLPAAELARCGDVLPADLRAAIELGAERTGMFAAAHRDRLTDFETELIPGLVVGYRYVPVGRVGAYLPAGRFPLTASAFMTVNVAKTAGVPTVIGCTPSRTPRTSRASTACTSSAASRPWRPWPSGSWPTSPST
jgi:sulfopropanediol 3-dehydrogenase